jgi:hypothetical protein
VKVRFQRSLRRFCFNGSSASLTVTPAAQLPYCSPFRIIGGDLVAVTRVTSDKIEIILYFYFFHRNLSTGGHHRAGLALFTGENYSRTRFSLSGRNSRSRIRSIPHIRAVTVSLISSLEHYSGSRNANRRASTLAAQNKARSNTFQNPNSGVLNAFEVHGE